MTIARATEFRIDARLLPLAPVPGSMFRLPTKAGTVLLVGKVVRVIDRQVLTAYRLVGTRLRAATLAEGAVILPWPARSVGRPRSRAAEAPAPTDKPVIVTKAAKQAAERKRITQQRRELASDPANALVDPVRRANSSAVPSTWRDPEDRNVLRKTPKTVSAFRADDPIDRLQSTGTISRGQAWAARRLRIDFERGQLQQKGCVDLSRGSGGGFESGTGPAEYVLMALERYQASQKALGRLFDFVFAIVIEGVALKAHAARIEIHPAAASGRLFASLTALQTHYEAVTPKPEEPVRHSIGSQVGPLEPSAPPAAMRWAAD